MTALTWQEFPGAVEQAAGEEASGVKAPSITTMEDLRAFLGTYHHAGGTFRELLADPLFTEAYDFVNQRWGRMNGQDPRAFEHRRIEQDISMSALSPIEAMRLHNIGWF